MITTSVVRLRENNVEIDSAQECALFPRWWGQQKQRALSSSDDGVGLVRAGALTDVSTLASYSFVQADVQAPHTRRRASTTHTQTYKHTRMHELLEELPEQHVQGGPRNVQLGSFEPQFLLSPRWKQRVGKVSLIVKHVTRKQRVGEVSLIVKHVTREQRVGEVPLIVKHVTREQRVGEVSLIVKHVTREQRVGEVLLIVKHVTRKQRVGEVSLIVKHVTREQRVGEVSLIVKHVTRKQRGLGPPPPAGSGSAPPQGLDPPPLRVWVRPCFTVRIFEGHVSSCLRSVGSRLDRSEIFMTTSD
ncbi:hypothetical protein LSAT2_019483 [Lamellibrachia satsuma]|nr:hypothetical protein LSAT2_019483 [Lamellibrachia satsuma]